MMSSKFKHGPGKKLLAVTVVPPLSATRLSKSWSYGRKGQSTVELWRDRYPVIDPGLWLRPNIPSILLCPSIFQGASPRARSTPWVTLGLVEAVDFNWVDC